MGNSLVTVDQLARDASLLMTDRLRVARACSTRTESLFANKVGDSVKIQIPPVFTGQSQGASVSVTAEDMTQGSETVTIEKHFTVAVNITSKERTMKLDDFNRNVTVPAVNRLKDLVDSYLLLKCHGLQLWSGTGGTAPSTVAHIVAARKLLQDAKLSGDYMGVISTTTEASLLQLAQFQSRDYAGDVATVDGMLGKRFGIDWLVTPNTSSFTRGDVAGTVLVNNASTAIGNTTLPVDAFTNATGTVYAGTHFTVAGDTTVYVVTADATKASNAATLSIYPPLQVAVANDALVTFKAAATDDFVLVRGALAAAIIAPAPLAVGSAIANVDGMGVRVTSGTSTANLSDTIVFDVMCGATAAHRYAGGIWQA